MVGIGLKNLNLYSLLALSTHKNVKCYPTMTRLGVRSRGFRALAVGGRSFGHG